MVAPRPNSHPGVSFGPAMPFHLLADPPGVIREQSLEVHRVARRRRAISTTAITSSDSGI